jgi:amino acid transporter
MKELAIILILILVSYLGAIFATMIEQSSGKKQWYTNIPLINFLMVILVTLTAIILVIIKRPKNDKPA